MIFSLDGLKEAGAFSGAPVKKDVSWEQDGEVLTATVYIRRISFKTFMADATCKGDESLFMAGRIASCLCDETGKAIFTVDDITGDADPQRGPLDYNLTKALADAIGEVNGMGKPKPSTK
jgi:hypothetical protein